MMVVDRLSLPPVLLLHGMCCTGATLEPLRIALAGLGLRVEAPTLGGYPRAGAASGVTATAPHGLKELFDEAAARVGAIKASTGLAPIVVGHSNGGLLALVLAARGLTAAAVLVAPAPVSSVGGAPRWLKRLIVRRIFGRGWQDRWVCFTLGGPGSPPPALDTTLLADSGRAMDDALDADCEGPFDPTPPVPCPLAIVCGGADRMVPAFFARRMAKKFGASLETLPESGHWLICERDGIERIARIVGSLAASGHRVRHDRAGSQVLRPAPEA
jgi:pimeloyl-ACP methyl ester carboxylesterase